MYSMRAAFSSWSLARSSFDGSSWAWPTAISKEQRITPYENRIANDLRLETNPDSPFPHNKDNLSGGQQLSHSLRKAWRIHRPGTARSPGPGQSSSLRRSLDPPHDGEEREQIFSRDPPWPPLPKRSSHFL